MIRLEDVHKWFADTHAVRGISLEIPDGQILGILGPNGAGKSTTIRMIAALIPPSRGSIAVNDHDTLAHSRAARANLGYLPEANPLHPEMRVRDYLRFRARLFALPAARRKPAADAAIERCWLADVAHRRIGHLSKGYRQRVGLAAALLHDPPVLILDEPTNGLDPSQIAETRDLIRELAGNRTMILVSHILPEVHRTCDRIVVIARGKVRADAPPNTLLASAPRAIILEARPRNDASTPLPIQPIKHLDGVAAAAAEHLEGQWTRIRVAPSGAQDLREPLARLAADQQWLVRELRHETASLEAFYLRLIQQADEEDAAAEQRPAA